MKEKIKKDDLEVLKVIAETLNRSYELEGMLQSVLSKLLKVTGLETGWIFLVDGKKPHYTFMASHHLPPALSWGNYKAMCNGTCYCLNNYWDGKLMKPINIIECKRLRNAIINDWGNTNAITHHATIPLSDGEEQFGILNVASPNKQFFSEDELTLLESVAYQIGTAIKRTKLYHSQMKRAESLALLDEVVRYISGLSNFNMFPQEVVNRLHHVFRWPFIAFYIKEGNALKLHASNQTNNKNYQANEMLLDNLPHDIKKSLSKKQIMHNIDVSSTMDLLDLPEYPSSIIVPIVVSREAKQGIIIVGGKSYNSFSASDLEVLKLLADHISIAIEEMLINAKQQKMLVLEERNRLARDLHDSVNQKLFSLSLTSRAVKEMIREENHELQHAMDHIQEMTQSALTEMKSLIWQLRPVGLEGGLITAWKNYGRKLGLSVIDTVHGVYSFPTEIEEALWRIGQEALNNVKKHANTHKVLINLQSTVKTIFLEISDQGKGFKSDMQESQWSLGLHTMKERTEKIGGSLFIQSKIDEGTTITVEIPWRKE